MKKTKGCDQRSCFMCKCSLAEWQPAIASHKKNFIAKKGEVIIREGSPVEGVYFVISGNVKVHKHWGEKELILRFANKGAIFGHRGITTTTSLYPISATTLEETELCYVDIDFFKATLKVNHELAYQLLMFYADELHTSERKMRALALMSVKSRLANAILELNDQFGRTPDGFINLALSRQDLAAFTGATYETVFRTINEMLSEKLIEVSSKQIAVKDEIRLKELANI